MNDLKTLVEGIVSGVIEARFDADLRLAELAEYYRQDPVLGTLNLPSLNISHVSVDLKIAFNNDEIKPASEIPSADQLEAIQEATDRLRTRVSRLSSVTSNLIDGRTRVGFLRTLESSVTKMATESVSKPSRDHTKALENVVMSSLREKSIEVDNNELLSIRKEIKSFNHQIVTAKKPQGQIPGILVGAEALSKVDPNAVSSIKFDINLESKTWVALDGETEGENNTLSQ